jgi:hypothetical protein
MPEADFAVLTGKAETGGLQMNVDTDGCGVFYYAPPTEHNVAAFAGF